MFFESNSDVSESISYILL